jgi:hypothetical protein
LRVSGSLLRAGAWFVPMLRELVEMEYLWRVPHALDGVALQRAIGALLSTPLPDALRAALSALPICVPQAQRNDPQTAVSSRRHAA